MKKTWDKLSSVKGSQWILLALALSLTMWAFLPQGSTGDHVMTEEEQRISRILSAIENAGECHVVIFYEERAAAYSSGSQTPCGAVIVSQGAHDLTVQWRLMLAAQTLLRLPPESVQIFPMEETP